MEIFPAPISLCSVNGANALFQAQDELYEKYQTAKKKFIAVSNTNKENFVSAFQNHLKNGAIPDILFLSARKYHQSSLAGELMDSADAREDLIDFLSQ